MNHPGSSDPKATNSVPRRTFLASAASVAAGFTIVPRHVLGAPDQPPPSGKLNIGCIGIGGQGGGVTRELATFPGVKIAALCDVDEGYSAHTIKP